METTQQTLPSLFISHGSPMLALDPGQVGAAFQRISHNLPRPKAIIVMSAHWQSSRLEVSTQQQPDTWHDFGGFPDALYQLRYPAPGAPQLAERLITILGDKGIAATPNSIRPRDHGVWMPLLHLYPEADIPVIQLSLPHRANARDIYAIGLALQGLRNEQILLIGSGSITHNLAELDWRGELDGPPEWASAFKNWVINTLASDGVDQALDWVRQAPYALRNHPTDEHFLPLFFALGAGQRFSVIHSSFAMGSLGMDIYRFD